MAFLEDVQKKNGETKTLTRYKQTAKIGIDWARLLLFESFFFFLKKPFVVPISFAHAHKSPRVRRGDVFSKTFEKWRWLFVAKSLTPK